MTPWKRKAITASVWRGSRRHWGHSGQGPDSEPAEPGGQHQAPCKATDADTVNRVLAALHGIVPRDELEGMLAVQMVGVHSLAMECMRNDKR